MADDGAATSGEATSRRDRKKNSLAPPPTTGLAASPANSTMSVLSPGVCAGSPNASVRSNNKLPKASGSQSQMTALQDRSVDANEPTFVEIEAEERKRMKRLPFQGQFHQGTLPAVQVTLEPLAMISWLVLSALVGVTLGVVVVLESDKIWQTHVSYGKVNGYTYPRNEAESNASRDNGGVAFTAEGAEHWQGWRTRVNFTVDQRVLPPIYLSYTVNNMMQSYWLYDISRNDLQLQGQAMSTSDLVTCRPLRAPGELHDDSLTRNTISVDGKQILYGDMIYYPCGVIAWTLFNDSITLLRIDDFGNRRVVCNASDFTANGERISMSANDNPCTKKGIAWPSDTKTRFVVTEELANRPNHWSALGRANASDEFLRHGWYFKEPGHRVPDIVDEDLMVWMRTASLPNFRKIHRVIHTPLEPGTYELVVNEFFDVKSFKGNKGILLRNHSWLYARNYTLGIFFTTGGAISLVIAIASFARLHMKKLQRRQRRADAAQQPPTAATSGREMSFSLSP
jgi:hypothetical protein